VKILIIHQNFPGQFRQLVPHLLAQGHDLRALCSHKRSIDLPIQLDRYEPPDEKALHNPVHGLCFWSEALIRAPIVWQHCLSFFNQGWHPDLILGHSGWGETLLLHEIWPNIPQIIWPEMWIQPIHAGIGIEEGRDEPTLAQRMEFESRNQLTRAALSHATAWVVATRHQAESFPSDLRCQRLNIIHEGINTAVARPDLTANYIVRGISIDSKVPTITFVNRNLERLRGFHQFMRALPIIQRCHPTVRVMIIGDNGTGYAGGEVDGRSLREVMLEELDGQLDIERLHFLGRIPYQALIAILQASWVHVYLTYPYILGWSLLEAMACGCCIVGSSGMPLEEVIQHSKNGMLVKMDQPKKLAYMICSLLANSGLRQQLGSQARLDSLGWDQSIMLPRLEELLLSVAASK